MKKILLLLALLQTLARADGLPTTPYIYVQGSATESVMPDTLTISFSLSVTDMDQAKAKLAVSEKSSAVFKMLKDIGIPDRAVSAFAIGVSPQYDNRSSITEFLGYAVRRSFSVKLTDLNLYSRLVDGLLTLHLDQIREAAPSSSKVGTATSKLKDSALFDARKQADEIAAKMGAKVVSVFAVSPIPPEGIKSAMFREPAPEWNERDYEEFVTTGSSLTVKGDRYLFEPIKLFERIHVIFLIEPVRK